ncbi:hypothetical protein HVZ71_19395 [Escherichia coli]|nr:hypothetical protein HVZ71_19395 [Escherichia coli]
MAFNALLFMQSWFYLDVLLEIVMNKIYRLKWNRSRNCWSVCSELGSRVKGKKSRAVLIREGANKQVISSQADSLIKISRIWADFFPANTSNQPI